MELFFEGNSSGNQQLNTNNHSKLDLCLAFLAVTFLMLIK